MRSSRSPLAALVLAAALAACAGRIPLPKHLEVTGLSELKGRMAAAGLAAEAYTAEVRLTYFGPDGRMKGTASIAVKRPSSLRYELQGPHGGVLSAFATNGQELQLFDMKESRFFYGPATAENIDRLLGIAPIGFGPAEWVALLFGEISIPDTAQLSYDSEIGRFVLQWHDAGKRLEVEVDPATSRVSAAVAREAEREVSDIRVEDHDDAGLPVKLRLRVWAAETDVEIRLRDVDYGRNLDDSIFVLPRPRKVTPEYLGE